MGLAYLMLGTWRVGRNKALCVTASAHLAPGDYMKDFARDPVTWTMKETREHPYWVG